MLGVRFSGTANGTPVQLYDCNETNAQQFAYFDGQIVYLLANKCIDAQDMANGRQLIINDCDGPESQNWQIK